MDVVPTVFIAEGSQEVRVALSRQRPRNPAYSSRIDIRAYTSRGYCDRGRRRPGSSWSAQSPGDLMPAIDAMLAGRRHFFSVVDTSFQGRHGK
jgi:hypothetical protein